MKFLPALVSFSMLLAIADEGFAQVQPAYIGDKASFAAFTKKYGKVDWPLPETIAYFDPAGTKKSVIRYARWIPVTTPAKGVVVHFNGRTEFIERNIYTYKDLLDRGFEVWALDWRGQGLSERQNKAKQRHSIDSFDTYVSDAKYFIDNVARIKDANGKKILLAHSMGGQIALRYLLSDAGRSVFDYAVFSSPLLRLNDDGWYVRLGNLLKNAIGFGSQCVFRIPGEWKSDFKVNACNLVETRSATESALSDIADARKYSHDWNKIADANCLIESSKNAGDPSHPDLRLACPTSGWLHAAFQSTDIVMKNSSRLTTPALIIRAKPDAAVDIDGQTEFCATAKIRCVDIEKEGGTPTGHELLIETQAIRARFLTEFDKFVNAERGQSPDMVAGAAPGTTFNSRPAPAPSPAPAR
jgi:lysophospholipase